jgi:Sulfotransferase family
MLVGHVGRIQTDFIGGWAADTEAPDSIVDVIIYVDGKRATRISCDRLREDLRDLQIYGEGRHGFAWHISPALSLQLLDRITVRYARTGTILPDGQMIPPAAGGLGAILITAPGRSGTTLMMSRLSRSRQICIAEIHPFEVRLISYWSTVANILAGKADYAHSMHPDKLRGDGFKVGSNPFSHEDFIRVFGQRGLNSEYFNTYVPQQLQDLSRRMILEYYLRVRDDQTEAPARFFAEKNDNLERVPRLFARTLFPGLKEVVLIRDPRDLLCSHMAYFQNDQELALQHLTLATRELMRIKREESDSVLLVRYEDMILDARPTFARVGSYLGVESLFVPDDASEKSSFGAHGTSASPEASIGRWRSQLAPEQQALCNETWRIFLAEFQYAD